MNAPSEREKARRERIETWLQLQEKLCEVAEHKVRSGELPAKRDIARFRRLANELSDIASKAPAEDRDRMLLSVEKLRNVADKAERGVNGE